MDFLEELNNNQQNAVLCIDKPSLVIAGAGSGKTRVLTYKIAFLISKGLPANRILALTFTNKAADEMKSRIDSLLGKETSRYIWMNTFHSIFYRFLRQEAENIGFKPNFTINDSDDSISLIKSIIKDMDLDPKIYEAKSIAHKISTCKNNLILPINYEKNLDFIESDKAINREYFVIIYDTYFNRCRKLNIMDFDDLLLYMFLLFDLRSDLLEKYQNMFDFILVDEYQDTNLLQYHILKRLAAKHHRISVVGDDSQSIYSFRNARIENILTFQKDYPESKVFKLTQNYRSTQNIVNLANLLIEKNKNKIPKTVFSENEEGSKVNYQSFYTDKEESAFLVNKIIELIEKHKYNYKDFAILYRSNSQSRVIEEYLRKNKILYRVYGGTSFYQRKEVKDALAYLRFIINSSDIEAFNRIVNYPSRKIGDATISKIRNYSIQKDISINEALLNEHLKQIDINKATEKKLITFREFIEHYRLQIYNLDAHEIAKNVLEESGLISELKSDLSPEGIARYENLEELLNGIKDFCNENESEIEAESKNLINYIGSISVLTSKDDNNSDDCVTLMTVHSSKGLEFKNVFIIGMESGVFPSFYASSPKSIEEERRLFYVAITRAEKNLFISSAENKYFYGSIKSYDKSIFINDIQSDYLVDNSFYLRKNFNTIFNLQEENKQTKNIIEKNKSKNLITIEEMKKKDIKQYDNSNLKIETVVNHEKFGIGTVISISDDRVVISFNGENKTLLTKFAKLEIVK